MTDHLPECCMNMTDAPPDGHCICDRLRVCEQRVREEERRNVIGSVSLAAIGEANVQQYHLGYAAALSAARDAVKQAWVDSPADALAAIDALRGES